MDGCGSQRRGVPGRPALLSLLLLPVFSKGECARGWRRCFSQPPAELFHVVPQSGAVISSKASSLQVTGQPPPGAAVHAGEAQGQPISACQAPPPQRGWRNPSELAFPALSLRRKGNTAKSMESLKREGMPAVAEHIWAGNQDELRVFLSNKKQKTLMGAKSWKVSVLLDSRF